MTSLKEVLTVLHKLAPLSLAEKWDNVGLLVEPSTDQPIKSILLTNDLTAGVMDEAIALQTSLIISYHPPIFEPLKQLTNRTEKQKLIVQAIENRIAVYSPHTALDSANQGLNDWLASAFTGNGFEGTQVEPIKPSDHNSSSNHQFKIVVFTPENVVEKMREELSQAGAGVIGNYSQCSFGLHGTGTFLGNDAANPVVGNKGKLEEVKELRMEMVCPKNKLSDIAQVIKRVHPYEEPAWDIYPLQAPPSTEPVRDGVGRLITLKEPLTIAQVLAQIKTHLGVPFLRLASRDQTKQIKKIAVCAGSGISVLKGVKADVYWTGEMPHHDILASNATGTSVVLSEHSSSERPFLATFKNTLGLLLKDVRIDISKHDVDPIVYL